MYVPNYDAVFVSDHVIQPHSLPAVQVLANVLPFQPPRRRRPILAVMDLLQKRYNLHAADQTHVGSTASGGLNTGDSVATGVTSNSSVSATSEGAKSSSNMSSEGSNRKPVTTVHKSNNTAQNTEKVKASKNNVDIQRVRNDPQISRIYSLLDSLMKSQTDVPDGFSYTYKYRLPQTPNKLDVVEHSVQQSLGRFPYFLDSPREVFKKPIDYQKAQEKLDSLLEEGSRSGGPIHLNTPGAFGPVLLNHYLEKHPEDKKEPDPVVPENQEDQERTPTKLILRPVAKAVAGPKGIAVASPVAKAVLRKGQPVTLEFEPDAVAIAGPGGSAHSHPEFTIDYLDSKESEN